MAEHQETGSALQHQFDDASQQKEASTLGMWAFLVTEILFFGGMFVAYIVYRAKYLDAFSVASQQLDVVLGGVNTAVLLLSSLTVALGVHAAQEGKRKQLISFLVATILLAGVFLVIKAFEYSHKVHENLFPGSSFHLAGAEGMPGAQLFFVLYFAMTGVHGIHVVVGMVIFAVIIWMAIRNKFSAGYYTPIEMSGLYWHFVDIVWIFLYPFLYLISLQLD